MFYVQVTLLNKNGGTNNNNDKTRLHNTSQVPHLTCSFFVDFFLCNWVQVIIGRERTMEKFLNEISGKYIQLDDSEIDKNNKVLHIFLDIFLKRMKDVDKLFNELFTDIYYGGSYYNGLKIVKPDEYDLNLKLVLPSDISYHVQTDPTLPGYVKVQLLSKTERINYTRFSSLVDQAGYLDTPKFLSWMKSIFHKTVATFPHNSNRSNEITLTISESGPAQTMQINGKISIDMVPCFVIDQSAWPASFRRNLVRHKDNFYVIAKPLKEPNTSRLLRPNFQQQEDELIKDKVFLKPAVKLLKRIKEKYNHNIASYYIKTIALWMVDKESDAFWSSSLTEVFRKMLYQYIRCIEEKNLPYYWNPANNLLNKINDDTLNNVGNLMRRILYALENNPENMKQFFD